MSCFAPPNSGDSKAAAIHNVDNHQLCQMPKDTEQMIRPATKVALAAAWAVGTAGIWTIRPIVFQSSKAAMQAPTPPNSNQICNQPS